MTHEEWMRNAVTNALASIANASECIDEAERAQADMDPIEGPGSSEWEIIREMLSQCEGMLRLAYDEPGALEAEQGNADDLRERIEKKSR
jgi:hypothetical protein